MPRACALAAFTSLRLSRPCRHPFDPCSPFEPCSPFDALLAFRTRLDSVGRNNDAGRACRLRRLREAQRFVRRQVGLCRESRPRTRAGAAAASARSTTSANARSAGTTDRCRSATRPRAGSKSRTRASDADCVEVCGARRHRSADTSEPRRGHHSQMPVSDRMSMPTPAQPTIWRPEYCGMRQVLMEDMQEPDPARSGSRPCRARRRSADRDRC